MTEAVRPTEAIQFHPTRVISGDVLTSPVSLTHAINVTDTAPRASLGNLSADMRQGTSLGEKAAAVVLAFGMLGGGKVILDSQRASAQSPSLAPSAEPSQDPNIAKADPTCPPGMVPTGPEVGPSPTPLPEPSIPGNIGMLPNKGVLFSFIDGQGRTVTVSSQAQEAPVESAAPSAPASPVIPETAAIDCEPDHGLPFEEIEAKYSLDVLFNMEHKPINDAEFERRIMENMPVLLDIYQKMFHSPDFDTAEEVWGDYALPLLYVQDHPTLKQHGPDLFAQTLLTNLKNARTYAQTSIIKADALWSATVSLYELGLNDIKIKGKNLDAKIAKWNNYIATFK